MLSWEEDTSSAPLNKPAPVVTPAAAVESNLLPNRPMPLPMASASAPSPQMEDAAERRVNVADKRIINGKTDVNQLVPFKYNGHGKNTWPVVLTTGCLQKSQWQKI